MHINLYIYQYENKSKIEVFEYFQSIADTFKIKFSDIGYLYRLSEKKADHLGDFKSKLISKKKLIDGIKAGEIDSYALGTTSDLRDPKGYFIDVNSENYGGIRDITLHFPMDTFDIFCEISDELVKKSLANYAFQVATESALKGFVYSTGSTIYKNEKGVSTSYFTRKEMLKQPRMLYPKNYFTKNHLEFVSNGVALGDFISSNFPELKLIQLSDSIYYLEVPSEKILELNNICGAAGFLAAWFGPNSRKLTLS